MSPIALHDDAQVASDLSARLTQMKPAADDRKSRKPLPDHGIPVAPDYMYDFKYNHPLPAHDADIMPVPSDTDATEVARSMVERLDHALGKSDAQAFADLFMEHGTRSCSARRDPN
jgi:hypothetical protein